MDLRSVEAAAGRKAILVLGPPRSGTSCLTGCLKICGAEVGRAPAYEPDHRNPKGYFENRAIYEFNVRTIKHLDVRALNPRAVQLREVPGADGELRRIVEREYGSARVLVIKDPRIVLLWPLYQSVLQGFDIQPIPFAIERDSIGTSRSINRFKGLDSDWSSLVRTYRGLIDEIAAQRRVLRVRFADLLKDPQAALTPICNAIGLEVSTNLRAFVDRSLVHFEV